MLKKWFRAAIEPDWTEC